MTQGPTVMFCLGATKAGTSWLYEHLAAHPDCHLRSIKELHYFDTATSGRWNAELRRHRTRLSALSAPARREAVEEKRDRRRADLRDWLSVMTLRREDRAAYLGYLTAGQGGAALVADITPAYALLPEDRLHHLASVAADTRFVYLMRDPVARLWSHVRMVARKAVRKAGGDFAGAARQVFDRTLAGQDPSIAERGDYASVLGRIDHALDPRRVLVLFQEAMMSAAGLSRLSAFLGIRDLPGDFARRVHEGAPLEMSAAQRIRARDYLRPQYDEIARRYPDLPDAWRCNMAEVTA